MGCCHLQDVLHVAAARIARSNRVRTASQGHLSCSLTKFYYRLDLGVKSMHMNRLVILRVCNKSNTVEPY